MNQIQADPSPDEPTGKRLRDARRVLARLQAFAHG